MPRLSLYRPNKQYDYRFFDRTIAEMLTVGGTDLYIHKYLGPTNEGASNDFTQPQYSALSPLNIQDLLFLENRDRTYDVNIYRLRGQYNVANLDFDLTQFGLFLTQDVIFIVVHYNDMIDIVGRKLMVGDVIELPHLLDYNPLDDTIKYALKRFYQITDSNFASEGFSQTWYPHLWRIKCEPLINSQEFSQILQEPANQDNYLGKWDPSKTYPPGYVISYGDKNYISIAEVPAGVNPPNSAYWQEQNDTLAQIMSTYQKNIEINNAVLEEAKREVPLSGYDIEPLYIVPTYGAYADFCIPSSLLDQPAPPIGVNAFQPIPPGTYPLCPVVQMRNPEFKNSSPAIRIPQKVIKSIWDMTADMDTADLHDKIDKFVQTSLEMVEVEASKTDSGSGSVEKTKILTVASYGDVCGPYGTSDNTFSDADQNLLDPGFTGVPTQAMDYRADADPRFQFIRRASARSFGYAAGYLTGNGIPPNGFPTGVGISFPPTPQMGSYFLRIDYRPQLLYRWDGCAWIRISEFVRTGTGLQPDDESQRATFINNKEVTRLTSGEVVPQAQALSTILTRPKPDLPPKP